jgi:ppGpp synthetase/RelA/SpoT-type nucleotidyltranferase
MTPAPSRSQLRLDNFLSRLSYAFQQKPIELYRELYGEICTSTAEVLEADVCSLFLRESDSQCTPPIQSLRLIASNHNGPWWHATRPGTTDATPIVYEETDTSTTTAIWKDGRAKFCNSFTEISEFRQLPEERMSGPGRPGKFDGHVWRGERLWGCFRSFMAVPIRIALPFTSANAEPPADDRATDKDNDARANRPITSVIGILKTENKTIPAALSDDGQRADESHAEYNARRLARGLKALDVQRFAFLQELLRPDWNGDETVKIIVKKLGLTPRKAGKRLKDGPDGRQNGVTELDEIWERPLKDVLTHPLWRELFLRFISDLLPAFDEKDQVILLQVAGYIARVEELRLTRLAAEQELPLGGEHFMKLPGVIDYRFIDDYGAYRKSLRTIVKSLEYDLKVLVASLFELPEDRVTSRLKSGHSFLRKLMLRRNREPLVRYHNERLYMPFLRLIDFSHLDIDDLGGIRVVCDFPKEVIDLINHIGGLDEVIVLHVDIKHPESKADEVSDGDDVDQWRTASGKPSVEGGSKTRRGTNAKLSSHPVDGTRQEIDRYSPQSRPLVHERRETGYYATHITLLVKRGISKDEGEPFQRCKARINEYLKATRKIDVEYDLRYRQFEEATKYLNSKEQGFNEATHRDYIEKAKRLRDHETKLLKELFLKWEKAEPGNLTLLERSTACVELQVRTAQHDTWANKYHRGFYKTFEEVRRQLRRRLKEAQSELKDLDRVTELGQEGNASEGMMRQLKYEIVSLNDKLERLDRARKTYVATADGINEQDVKLQMATLAMNEIGNELKETSGRSTGRS